MSEVEILTPRGVTLSGTFVDPVDTVDAAVLFSHSFFSDRHSSGVFDSLAAQYRTAGYATLMFDYSGHGLSDDEILSRSACVEDLRTASSWLAENGFPRQLLHGHSFGATIASLACPSAAKTMILTSAVLGPVSFDWQSIFSNEQLDDIEIYGATTVPDDSPGPRQNFTISRKTLVDLSLINTDEVFADIHQPIFVIHDADDEATGLATNTQEHFATLPPGSSLEIVRDYNFSPDFPHTDVLVDLCLDWARTHLPNSR